MAMPIARKLPPIDRVEAIEEEPTEYPTVKNTSEQAQAVNKAGLTTFQKGAN